MITPKETDSIIVSGSYYVEMLTHALMEKSAWFCVEPLPDNEWQIYFKKEQTVFIQNFAKERIYIPGWGHITKSSLKNVKEK